MDADVNLLEALLENLDSLIRLLRVALERPQKLPGRVSGLPPDCSPPPPSPAEQAVRPLPTITAATAPEPDTSVPADHSTSASAARHHKDALLEALRKISRPLKAEALAHRAELPYSSYIRKLLGELVNDGEVIHAPRGGYWLPLRPLPK